MLQSTTGTAGAATHEGKVWKLTLVPNRDNRPQYVTMVRYEARWIPITTDDGEEMEALRLVPVRRTMEWVCMGDKDDPLTGEVLVCTRVTELRWRDIKPTPAHRDMIDQWAQHMASVKKGARPIKVEVVP